MMATKNPVSPPPPLPRVVLLADINGTLIATDSVKQQHHRVYIKNNNIAFDFDAAMAAAEAEKKRAAFIVEFFESLNCVDLIMDNFNLPSKDIAGVSCELTFADDSDEEDPMWIAKVAISRGQLSPLLLFSAPLDSLKKQFVRSGKEKTSFATSGSVSVKALFKMYKHLRETHHDSMDDYYKKKIEEPTDPTSSSSSELLLLTMQCQFMEEFERDVLGGGGHVLLSAPAHKQSSSTLLYPRDAMFLEKVLMYLKKDSISLCDFVRALLHIQHQLRHPLWPEVFPSFMYLLSKLKHFAAPPEEQEEGEEEEGEEKSFLLMHIMYVTFGIDKKKVPICHDALYLTSSSIFREEEVEEEERSCSFEIKTASDAFNDFERGMYNLHSCAACTTTDPFFPSAFTHVSSVGSSGGISGGSSGGSSGGGSGGSSITENEAESARFARARLHEDCMRNIMRVHPVSYVRHSYADWMMPDENGEAKNVWGKIILYTGEYDIVAVDDNMCDPIFGVYDACDKKYITPSELLRGAQTNHLERFYHADHQDDPFLIRYKKVYIIKPTIAVLFDRFFYVDMYEYMQCDSNRAVPSSSSSSSNDDSPHVDFRAFFFRRTVVPHHHHHPTRSSSSSSLRSFLSHEFFIWMFAFVYIVYVGIAVSVVLLVIYIEFHIVSAHVKTLYSLFPAASFFSSPSSSTFFLLKL